MTRNLFILTFLILIFILNIIIFYYYIPVSREYILYDESLEVSSQLKPNKDVFEKTFETGYIAKKLLYDEEDELYDDEGNIDKGSAFTFNNVSSILSLSFKELDKIETQMYKNSDNCKKTSCEILNKNTFNTAYKIINDILYVLFNYMNKKSVIHIEKYLNSTYDKYSLLYRYINKNNIVKISNINVVFVTNHHEANEWIYREFPYDTLPTILHVDTHPDINTPHVKNSNTLYEMKDRIINNDTEALTEYYKEVLKHDIGNVLIPSIFPYKNNGGVIWIYPEWTINVINNGTHEAALLKKIEYDDKVIHKIAYNTLGDGDPDLKQDNNSIFLNKKAHFSSNKLRDTDINEIPNEYILNLDLDYFVTYGVNDSNNKDDPTSYNRTIIDFNYANKNSKYKKEVTQNLENEFEMIRKRIDEFIIFIKKLYDNGKKPCFIILCNSSAVNKIDSIFSEPWQCGEVYHETVSGHDLHNEYTPKYLSLWLQNTLLHHLRLVLK
jgi:hypothetical protein